MSLLSLQVHNAIGWILVLVTLGLVGFYVPPSAAQLKESYLIFFFHYPSAVNCLNFFILAGIISAVFLTRGQRNYRLDLGAATAVEVGVVACTVTLVTGSIWAKAAWGVFWEFGDKRLMTVAIMWFTYVGYLALRNTVDEPEKRARFGAVFSVIAAINVPLVYFSIKWFGRVQHPDPSKFSLAETSMVVTRWFGAFAFLVLYTAFWRLRYRNAVLRHETERLEEGLARAGI